ncbi:MAG: hypothetical protein ACE5H8_15765 [Alphaproteobacteria bacterium]
MSYDHQARRRDVSPEALRVYNRRLTDKIAQAIEQADEQGRKEIVEHLRAIYQAIVDDDAERAVNRSMDDRRKR